MKSNIIVALFLILGIMIGYSCGGFFKIKIEEKLNLSSNGFGMDVIYYGPAYSVGYNGYDDPPVNLWHVMLDYYWDCYGKYPRDNEELKRLVQLHATRFGYIQFENENNPGRLSYYAEEKERGRGYDYNYRLQLNYESKSSNEYTLELGRPGGKILIIQKRE